MPSTVIILSTLTASYFDVRWRRIPNWLVLLTSLVCLGWHGLVDGYSGILASAGGLLLGVVPLFPLFLLRGMGAGDVKYFGAIGAGVTHTHILTVLVISLGISAGMSFYTIVRRRRLRETLSNIFDMLRRFRRAQFKPHPVVAINNENALLVPFTLASSMATWLVVFFLA